MNLYPLVTSEELREQDLAFCSKALVEEVAKWKLEAKSEDNDRYFYHVKEASRIETGDKCYVIGRKGSGKTAISEYLCGMQRDDTFSDKLTFKNFPFNELYALKNDGYTVPNQYITLWKFLIYSFICKQMARNQAIESTIRAKLQELYGADQSSLSRKVSKWVGKDFSINIFGVGIKISNPSESNKSWIERVNVLEDLILTHVDQSRYFVIFDELDEDYRNIIEKSQYQQYTSLITSLFKAVQDIISVFKDRVRYNIFPVVFLRDDIYESE